jgi:murein DD-endopeptidase MepM/ murein hydrolase activator NlpD
MDLSGQGLWTTWPRYPQTALSDPTRQHGRHPVLMSPRRRALLAVLLLFGNWTPTAGLASVPRAAAEPESIRLASAPTTSTAMALAMGENPGALGSDASPLALQEFVGPVAAWSSELDAASAYRMPLRGPWQVVTPFKAPASHYSAGHRGTDFAALQGADVHAASAGRVRFQGQVAGRGVVVLAHPDGISTEYEPVTSLVHTGQVVVSGQTLGHLSGHHAGCSPATCLHWGARRGGVYLDPMSLLHPLGKVSLVPWK